MSTFDLFDSSDTLDWVFLSQVGVLLDDERKEYADAAAWYRRSAAQGFLLAKRRLANLLRFGKGSTDDDIHRQFVARDTAEAVALYREAATRGDPEAQFVLAQVRARSLPTI